MTFRILLISYLLLGCLNTGWSIVKFNDEEIREDFEIIIQEYELVHRLYARLSSSEITYILSYKDLPKKIDGCLSTDGDNLHISLKDRGMYSLQAIFVHEAVHALQFESGRIGFIKNNDGIWITHNVDLWDEAEAFLMTLAVVKKDCNNSILLKRYSKFLYEFNKRLECYGLEKAANWLQTYYPKLPATGMYNPTLGEGLVKWKTYFYIPYKTDSDYLNNFLILEKNK